MYIQVWRTLRSRVALVFVVNDTITDVPGIRVDVMTPDAWSPAPADNDGPRLPTTAVGGYWTFAAAALRHPRASALFATQPWPSSSQADAVVLTKEAAPTRPRRSRWGDDLPRRAWPYGFPVGVGVVHHSLTRRRRLRPLHRRPNRPPPSPSTATRPAHSPTPAAQPRAPWVQATGAYRRQGRCRSLDRAGKGVLGCSSFRAEDYNVVNGSSSRLTLLIAS